LLSMTLAGFAAAIFPGDEKQESLAAVLKVF
jgi:hypothetical protein